MNRLVRLSWGAAMLVTGCGSRLEVDHRSPGAGGGAGGTEIISQGGAGGGVMLTGGTGGFGSSAGGPVVGSVGQRCVAAVTNIEAQGTFAQTEVAVPEHCASGAACGSDGRCSAIPDCPQASGPCFVQRPDPGVDVSAAANGGFGGLSDGGASSWGGNGQLIEAARPEPKVVALASDDSHLYVLEYGTRDSIGNYQKDGTLISYPFDGGEQKIIANTLPGPVNLGITKDYAYVFVDGGPLIDYPTHPQLLRVPLAGGPAELVQDGTAPGHSGPVLLGAGDQAFWPGPDGLYAMASKPGATPAMFVDNFNWNLAADATHLYYGGTDQNTWRVPLTGGSPQPLGFSAGQFGVSGEFLYWIETIDNGTGNLLNHAPKAGGSPERVRALGAGNVASRFQVVDDRFFLDSNPPQQGPYTQPDGLKMSILTGTLSSSGAPIRLLELPAYVYGYGRRRPAWEGTASAFYWSDGVAVYSMAIPSSL